MRVHEDNENSGSRPRGALRGPGDLPSHVRSIGNHPDHGRVVTLQRYAGNAASAAMLCANDHGRVVQREGGETTTDSVRTIRCPKCQFIVPIRDEDTFTFTPLEADKNYLKKIDEEDVELGPSKFPKGK